MEYLNKIVEKLQKNRVKLIGSSDKEISELEKTIKTLLPKAYIEFLESMGNYTDTKNISPNLYDYAGFGGESIFYEDVYNDYTNKDGLIDQLKEDAKEELLKEIDDNVFVFSSHQGYIFAFFKLDEGDNPPVYGYHEGQERDFFPKLTDTLLQFFEEYLEYGKDPYNNVDE